MFVDLEKVVQERDDARQEVEELKEQRYTHVEVALWLSAYRGKYREKTLTDWVIEYREQQKQKEDIK